MAGYIKWQRSEETWELLTGCPLCHHLLSVIAYRARLKSGFNSDGLEPGEALLGDAVKTGLTRQQYRTALKKLEKWGFVTTKATNKGTIAKLCNTTIYDININGSNHQPNHQATIKQPSANHQATTNKESKNVIMKEGEENAHAKTEINIDELQEWLRIEMGGMLSGSLMDIPQYLYQLTEQIKTDLPNLDPVAEIKKVVQGASDFHRKNLAKPKYLLENFANIRNEMKQAGQPDNNQPPKKTYSGSLPRYDR